MLKWHKTDEEAYTAKCYNDIVTTAVVAGNVVGIKAEFPKQKRVVGMVEARKGEAKGGDNDNATK